VYDQVRAAAPNEIALSGSTNGQPIETVFRVETRRVRPVEASVAGRKEITNGRSTTNGQETTWQQKCNPGGGAAASVKEVFEKYGLLGTFAWDCSKPVSRQNVYYVHRALDAERVQRDIMEGPTTRSFVVTIDKVVETKPNEITVSGNRDGKPFSSIYRAEPNRIRVLESTTDGKLEITGGRFVNSGEFPAANKCVAASR